MVAHVLTWHIMHQQNVEHCQQYQELHVSYEKGYTWQTRSKTLIIPLKRTPACLPPTRKKQHSIDPNKDVGGAHRKIQSITTCMCT
ncbi:hypothetical protein AB3S75_032774 [Citrus x aurantiifolia]